jgi:hypothetical protein
VKLPSFKASVLVGAALGLLIPAASQGLPYSRFTMVLLQLWPASIFAMATAGREHELWSYVLVVGLVVANVIMYVALFAVLWAVGWLARSTLARLRGERTI